MRNLISSALIGLVAFSSFVYAEPATQSSDFPPPLPAATPSASGRVMVLPLTSGANTPTPWLGQALQQDIRAELTQKTRAAIDTPSDQGALDEAAALGRGREAGASYVVHGQYQVVSGAVNVSGEILDVATGKPVGNLYASGPASNLFPLENNLIGQVLHALPATWLTVALPAVGQDPATRPSVTMSSPGALLSAPQAYYSYTYPDYSAQVPNGYGNDYYDESYPYYWYSVPFYGPDLWFYGGYDYYHHHHGYNGYHDWYGHAFQHGVPYGYSHGPSEHSGGGEFHGGGGGFHGGGGGGAHGSGGGHR